MSAVPWLIAGAGATLAAVSAVADGALLADSPTLATPDRVEGLLMSGAETPDHSSPAVTTARLPERERAHRALAFARVLGHGVAGGALAVALALGGRTTPMKIVFLVAAGLATVTLAEAIARAVGDALGETAASRLAMFTRVMQRALSPLVQLGEYLDHSFARVLPDEEERFDRREAAAAQFADVVSAETDVSRDERELLLGVFSFGETTASEVMVPRVEIEALEKTTPWSEVVDHVRSAQHSRIPVYEKTIDEIVGVLYAKDLLGAVVEDQEPEGGWQTLVQPASFIPSAKRIADLLRDFKASRRHIAIVADEYGGTEGLVTIEDVLEELVGEIRDEYDDEERQVEEEDGLRYWVSGRLTLEDLSRIIGHDFTRDDVTTVGGLVLELLGRVPRAGEALWVDGFRVVVERVVRRKVERVFIERREAVVARSGEHS